MTINTTVEQLLDIEDALVSEEHPARDDGTFDYERCARLQNYLVAYGWMAHHGRETPDLDALAKGIKYYAESQESRDAKCKCLLPPLKNFWDMIYNPTEDFFYWVSSLNIEACDEYICYDENDLEDEGKARFVKIYHTTSELENHCVGVVFDQQLNRASFPLTIGDIENGEPVDEREDIWFPLETILTHWSFLI